MKVFDVEVVLNFDSNELKVAASRYLSEKDFPQGNVISDASYRAISQQEIADYESFVDTIADLFEDYYGLQVAFTSQSKYLSHYYVLIAKDSNGELLFKFRFKLRISTHEAKRTASRQQRKAEENKAIQQLASGKKLRPINRDIVVNNQEFDSYYQAYEYIDDEIQEVLEKVRK